MDNPSQWRTHIFQDGWSHQPATFGWFFWQVLVNIPAPWSIWEWWMDSANVRKLWSWAMGFASLSRFQSAIKVDCEIIQYERILQHPKLGQIWNHQKYYVIIASNNLKKRFAKYIISKQCNNVENRDHVVSFFFIDAMVFMLDCSHTQGFSGMRLFSSWYQRLFPRMTAWSQNQFTLMNMCTVWANRGIRGPGKTMLMFPEKFWLSRHNHQQFSQIIGNYEQILNS